MDIDFSLVLVLLVAGSGAIWLFDALFLAPGRRRAGQQREEQQEPEEQEPWLVEYARSFFPVLLIVLLLRSFLVEPFQIPSGSMVPTLEVGDFILVNKYTYGLRLPVLGTKLVDVREPRRGEVMVFFPPHENRYFIKRVVGLPGDTVSYENGRLAINGEPVETEVVEEIRLQTGNGSRPGTLFREELGVSEHLAQRVEEGNQRRRTRWVVPPGHYFMMGDNRDNSADSRVWGAVPEENIVGKAFAIWMHKDPGWNLPTFSRNALIN